MTSAQMMQVFTLFKSAADSSWLYEVSSPRVHTEFITGTEEHLAHSLTNSMERHFESLQTYNLSK